jgi:hypothetical protein
MAHRLFFALPRLAQSCVAIAVFSAALPIALHAVETPPRTRSQFPDCGTMYAEPFGRFTDAGRRPCPVPAARNYTPVHHGIGFDVLALESEACFVPDESLRLLDEVIAAVLDRVPKPDPSSHVTATPEFILAISSATGDVLAEKGFGLYIPTETLGDALYFRNAAGEQARHIVDCDTSSMILMTVADAFSLTAALVEITLTGGSQHNYVRWTAADGTTVDWDTNGRGQCLTPHGQPSFQGVAQTRQQTMAYAYRLRAIFWKSRNNIQKAMTDYRESARLYPEHPYAFNNFAWIVATKEYPERASNKDEAIAAANRAVAIQRIPDYLDTLACVYAYAGDFARAAAIEQEAAAGAPSKTIFADRVRQFNDSSPKDCTGAD